MPPGKSGRRGTGLQLPYYAAKTGKKRAKNTTFLATRTGGRVALRKALSAGGLYREKRRPAWWRSLAPSLTGGSPVPEHRLNDWLLVLTAKKIPHSYTPSGDRPRLYVPALYESVALHEIRAFEQERAIPIFVPPVRGNMPGVVFFLLLLLCWHGLRWGWFGIHPPSPPFPAEAGGWSPAFGLDMYRAKTLHEWWRTITALTLHADDSHVFSNLGFGLLFLGALCRRAGLGLGIGLAVLAGIFGNVCNALTREGHVISIGFSTALFGAVGSLCCLAGADIFRHHRRFSGSGGGLVLGLARRLALPLAAGMALLGLLGGGGEARTDYPAHIWGFCAGLAVTMAALPLEKSIFSLPERQQTAAQGGLFAAALLLLAGAWLYAL